MREPRCPAHHVEFPTHAKISLSDHPEPGPEAVIGRKFDKFRFDKFRGSRLRWESRAGLTVRKHRGTRSIAPNLTAVLKIARDHVEAMIAHAREDHPDEACGVIVGPEGSDIPTRLVRMINADRSPTFFRFEPEEQFALYKQLSTSGEEIVVVYHSHTATEAYPSRTDISLASEPQAHYVIVSTAESGAADGPVSVRSFRIVEGAVTEEEIDVTE